MAIQSYNIDPNRVGTILSLSQAYPKNGADRRQKISNGLPEWKAPVLLADQGLEVMLTFASDARPTFEADQALQVSGATSFIAWSGRTGGQQNAGLTLKAEYVEVTDEVDDDLMGANDYGLHVVDPGPLKLVKIDFIETRYPRTGDWSRYSVTYTWKSEDNSGSGTWEVDIPRRPQTAGFKKRGLVEFDGLRVVASLNQDGNNFRAGLEAMSVRPVEATEEPSSTRRPRRYEQPESTPEPVGADA